jgi:O-antigen/teichoic acid export membrane protein
MIRKILERSIWLTAGAIIGRSGPVIGGGLLIKSVGLDSFAPLAALLAFMIIFPALTTQPVGLVLTQGLAAIETPRERVTLMRRGYQLALGYVIFVALGLFALAQMGLLIKVPGLSSPHLTNLTLVGGIFMAGIVLSQAMLNGLGQVRYAAASMALTGLLQGAIMLYGAIQQNVPLVKISLVISLALLFLVNSIFISRVMFVMTEELTPVAIDKTKSRSTDHSQTRWLVLLQRSGLTLLSSLFVVPVTYICADFLHVLPDGEAQYSAFVVLEQIIGIIGYLPALLAQASLPVLSQELAKSPQTGSLLFLRRILPAKILLALLVATFGFALAPFFQHIFGVQISKYVIATQWAIAYAALMIPLVSVGTAVQARGRFIEGAVFNAIWAAVFIATAYFWGKHMGLEGIQMSRIFATFILLAALLCFFTHLARQDSKHKM